MQHPAHDAVGPRAVPVAKGLLRQLFLAVLHRRVLLVGALAGVLGAGADAADHGRLRRGARVAAVAVQQIRELLQTREPGFVRDHSARAVEPPEGDLESFVSAMVLDAHGACGSRLTCLIVEIFWPKVLALGTTPVVSP